MSTKNSISLDIPEQDVTAINDAVAIIQEKLGAYLLALTPEQRQSLPKMSDKTAPFVEKIFHYANHQQKFLPPFLDVDELRKDVETVNKLTEVFRPLSQLTQNLNDTIVMAGSEAYVACLAYYNSVRQAMKMNEPDAKTIYSDVKKRFERS